MSVNKAILIGRLGRDPEMTHTHSGTAVCNFNLATSETWKDKNTGEKQERTEWHRIVFFNRIAEICGQYLTKGSQIYIEGKIQTREWQDKKGERRWTTEIIGNEMKMLGGGGGKAPATIHEQGQEQTPGAGNQDDIPF